MVFKILLFVLAVTTAQLPSTIKKCNRRDSDFQECLPKAMEDVFSKSTSPIKEIRLPILDPLVVPSLTVEAGNSAVNFQQNYRNLKISGFSKTKCSKAEWDFEGKTFKSDCTTPMAILDFDYTVNGKILVLPISGNGTGRIELDNYNVKSTFWFEEYQKKGEKHYRVSGTEVVLNPELIRIHLENLFNGDKTLGDNINRVFNENWRDVFADVKPGYEEAFGKIFGAILNRVLAKVSLEEMFGPV